MISTGYKIPYILKKTPFKFENCLDFDGVNDYVSFSDTSIYCDSSLAWTFNIWIRETGGVPTAFPTPLALKTGVSNSPFVFFLNTAYGAYKDISFGGRTVTAKWRVDPVTPAFLNNWSMVTVTYDGVSPSSLISYRTYINGVSVTMLSGTSGFATTPDASVLNKSTSSMKGQMNNFAFWDSVLTPTQVSNQWNGGNGDWANIDVTPRTALYLNGSGTDTIAVDSSGNNNNGTLNNFPASGMWISH